MKVLQYKSNYLLAQQLILKIIHCEFLQTQIFHGSLFGNTLREVMQLQAQRWPKRRLPWPQVELSKQVLRLQGLQTEGIFRVSADVDEVAACKAQLDRWELPEPSGNILSL